MRRLPVYLLIDTSGSMRGEPIASVLAGLQTLTSALRRDPFALETVQLCLITFDREARVLQTLRPVHEFQPPQEITPESGPTHLGAALALLRQCLQQDIQPTSPDRKGDWKPLVFLMTDGSPSDPVLYHAEAAALRAMAVGTVVACAAGPQADTASLRALADTVVALDTADASTFRAFFQWVSSSVAAGNRSLGASPKTTLPPPPPEINLVL